MRDGWMNGWMVDEWVMYLWVTDVYQMDKWMEDGWVMKLKFQDATLGQVRILLWYQIPTPQTLNHKEHVRVCVCVCVCVCVLCCPEGEFGRECGFWGKNVQIKTYFLKNARQPHDRSRAWARKDQQTHTSVLVPLGCQLKCIILLKQLLEYAL